MNFLKLSDVDVSNKRVLLREDFNVPLENGKIMNEMRLTAALPTIKTLLEKNAAVILISHLGRPEEGVYDPAFSLRPVAARLNSLLNKPVRLIQNWIEGVSVNPGEVVLCENVRFEKGESIDDASLARRMAALCDIFVMDAFGVAHRAQASTHGVAQYAPVVCAGPLLTAEIEAITHALDAPKHPLVAIVGGSKVSTKLTVLERLIPLVDKLIVGGGIANTFLAAKGYPVGKSLYEPGLVDTAKQLLMMMKERGADVPLPIDVVVAKEFSMNAKPKICHVSEVMPEDMILDIGPKTADYYANILEDAGTIVWNGPVGVFELDAFAEGTRALAQAIARSQAYSLAGGGDTLAAVEKFGVENNISYLSTGGGAFLELLEGQSLPGITVLEQRK